MIDVSIIIRAYNEEKKLKQCLEAVFNQKTSHQFEVIIVDSGSTDKTLEIATDFKVKIINLERADFTYGKALNLGCQAGLGEYLVFLSAHALPFNDQWLNNLLLPFASQKVAGVYSQEIPFPDCNPLAERQLLAHNKKILTQEAKYSSFSNAGAGISKKVWEKIKFDEQLIASEDYDWAKKVKAHGYEIVYEPKAVVYHSHNENPRQIFNRYFREFCSTLLIDGRMVNFNYLFLGVYYLIMDTVYIFKNHYNFFWFLKSLFNVLLIFLAALLSFFKRTIKTYGLSRQ